MNNCIISVAVRKPYTDYQVRLIATAKQFGVDLITWKDEYPAGSRTHHDSLYGFKIYAFARAFEKGYDNVLWLDSPAYLLADPALIFSQIQADKHYLLSSELPLWKYCNNKTVQYFNYTRENIRENDFRLLSGSFIGLSKESFILDQWMYFEKRDFFLSAEQDALQVKEYPGDCGHRHDEAVLSLIAYSNKLKTVDHWNSHFQNDNAIVKSEKW